MTKVTKVHEDELHFAGLHGYASQCGVHVFTGNGAPIVVLEELPDNPGASVTNFCEHIANIVRRAHAEFFDGVHPTEIVWLEHYPRASRGVRDRETFDRIFFQWDGVKYSRPRWERYTREHLEKLIGWPFSGCSNPMPV